MFDSPNPPKPSLLMVQFLSWVADRPRSYAETMEAWRTSCPRLSVWEDAVIAGMVRLDGGRAVKLTEHGAMVLRQVQTGGREPAPAKRKPRPALVADH